MDFRVDVSKVIIAGSESSISKTIEELLELNKKIPARSKEEILEITQKQFESNSDTKGKRGEVNEVSERQLSEKNKGNKKAEDIIENQLDEAGVSDGGRNSDAWDKGNVKMRGHKDIPPIWIEVFKNEDSRKGNKTKDKEGK